jgi:hypothetical protein
MCATGKKSFYYPKLFILNIGKRRMTNKRYTGTIAKSIINTAMPVSSNTVRLKKNYETYFNTCN